MLPIIPIIMAIAFPWSPSSSSSSESSSELVSSEALPSEPPESSSSSPDPAGSCASPSYSGVGPLSTEEITGVAWGESTSSTCTSWMFIVNMPGLLPPAGDFCSYSSSFSSGISEIPEFFLLITWDFGGAADFVDACLFGFFFAFLGFLTSVSTLEASISVPVVAPPSSLGYTFGFLSFFLPLTFPAPPAYSI